MADVDPRFDPQFQRGYDPEVHGARVRRASVVEPVETPVVEPTRVVEPPSVVEPVETPTPVSTSSTTETAPSSTTDDDLDLPPLRRNPFRIALLLASVAAIGGSAALLWVRLTADPYGGYYGNRPELIFRAQFTDSLLLPLLTTGLVGLVLWLALGALRKRAR